MSNKYKYTVLVGEPTNEQGAEYTLKGKGNDETTEFFNFVGRSETLVQAIEAGLVDKASLSYNDAENPKSDEGATLVKIPFSGTANDRFGIFGILFFNARKTLNLPYSEVYIPNQAIESTGDTNFLITVEDGTKFQVTLQENGNVVSTPLGLDGQVPTRSSALVKVLNCLVNIF